MSNATCPGTGHRTGGFPGDEDVCPVCQRWIIVSRDTGLRKHSITPRRLAEWDLRQRKRQADGVAPSHLWNVR